MSMVRIVRLLISRKMFRILCLLTIFTSSTSFGQNVTTLVFDWTENDQTYQMSNFFVSVPIPNQLKSLSEMAYCSRFLFKTLRDQTLMSLNEGKIEVKFSYISSLNGGIIEINQRSYIFLYPNITMLPNQWQHFCFSYSTTHNNSLWLVINGQLLHDNFIDLLPLNWTLNNSIVNFGFRPNTEYHFYGTMTEVNIWSKALSVQTMTTITSTCQDAEDYKPDLFAWSSMPDLVQGKKLFITRLKILPVLTCKPYTS
jgi:hypothetical protein